MASQRPKAHGRRSSTRLSPEEKKNRAVWDRISQSYEVQHRKTLGGKNPMGWGFWHRPEKNLRLLGEVRGKDVLELGCGAARWSVALSQRGARVVGLDLSSKRLEQARAEMKKAGVEFPLLEASAESVPLPDESFDVVFSDWGAMTFANPRRTIPEVSRLLRPGGILVFTNSSVFRSVSHDRRRDRLGKTLLYDYFDLHRISFPDGVEHQLTMGEWIATFRANGLLVESLLELRPPPRARSSYLSLAEERWARHWPLEVIWKLRKSVSPEWREE